MWTQKACPCWSSRGGELVVGRGNGGQQPQCNDFRRIELQLQLRQKKQLQRLTMVAKVAVGDGGRQARMFTEGGETTTTKKNHHHNNMGCLEFAPGRLDNADRKVTGVGTQKGRVVVIAGPTAVGKSRIAIALAKQLRGEIISADSIQVPILLVLSFSIFLLHPIVILAFSMPQNRVSC